MGRASPLTPFECWSEKREPRTIEFDSLRLTLDPQTVKFECLRLKRDPQRVEFDALTLTLDPQTVKRQCLTLAFHSLRVKRHCLRPERDLPTVAAGESIIQLSPLPPSL
ncbi:hypothetical protein R11007_04098 [Ralstonia holmesii]|nr:hypothetical protein R11007_04098 [Ralstonia sp. LMG 32967]